MGTVSLIRRALHPGVSLKHDASHLTPVDALHALARLPEIGSILVHARVAQDNLVALQSVVFYVAREIFVQRDWVIQHRGGIHPDARFAMFHEQIWREFCGEPCPLCRGHGVVGRKFDQVRHHLASCGRCESRGYIIVPTSSFSVKTKKPLLMRKACPKCLGKTLLQIKDHLKAGRLRSCSKCWGSGTVPATVAGRARALHLDRKSVSKVWIERFRAVLATLRTLENDALIVCGDYLYGEETLM